MSEESNLRPTTSSKTQPCWRRTSAGGCGPPGQGPSRLNILGVPMQLSTSPSLRLGDADATIVPVLPAGEESPATHQVADEVGLDLADIASRFGLTQAGDHCWVPT